MMLNKQKISNEISKLCIIQCLFLKKKKNQKNKLISVFLQI